MITALRSIIACEKISDAGGKLSYIGVMGERLVARTQPGLVPIGLAIVLDLDGAETFGRLHLQAPGYDHTFPFGAPAGISATGLLLNLDIPILKVGTLGVRILDVGKGGRVFRSQFQLVYAQDAEILGPEAAGQIEAAANATASEVTSGGMPARLH